MQLQRLKKYAIGAGMMVVLTIAILLGTGSGSAVAAQITSVFVTNDASHAVPVRDQNTDTNGNIKVHEQGTANVTAAPATRFFAPGGISVDENSSQDLAIPGGRMFASLVEVANADENMYIIFLDGGVGRLVLGGANATGLPFGPGAANHDLTLTQPIPMDHVAIACGSNSGNPCKFELNIVGA
jgi:hypothetical protein